MSDFSVYSNIQKAIPQPSAAPPISGTKSEGPSFGNALKDAINQVNGLELDSQKEMDKFATDDTDLHSVMMALEKADVSFQLMMQVRNKIVSAYQDIMKTQV
jgi:flagellar hook-basal body complex protein FliE